MGNKIFKKIWNSIHLWRIITLISVIIAIFSLFPYERGIFLEKFHLKEKTAANISLEIFNNESVNMILPDFFPEIGLNNSKLAAFSIKAQNNNTLKLENVRFIIKTKQLGNSGIVFIKNLNIPQETHILTEKIRVFDNDAEPVKYIPLENIDPYNIQEKYKDLIGKEIVGAEGLTLEISELNPGELISFVIYYNNNPLAEEKEASINNFEWDVCYDYLNNQKNIRNVCLLNNKIMTPFGGRVIDYMIPASFCW